MNHSYVRECEYMIKRFNKNGETERAKLLQEKLDFYLLTQEEQS